MSPRWGSTSRRTDRLTVDGNVTLTSNDRGIHIQTHRLKGGIFFNWAVEMDSGVVIYIPSFIKIGSGILKLIGMGGVYRHTHTDSNVIS
jgi:hypothetical protein